MKKLSVILLAVLLGVLLTGVVGAQAGSGESPLPTPMPTATVTPPGDGGDVPQVELSGTGIAALVAVISSVVMAYIPGAAAWWESYPHKRTVIGALGLALAVGMVGLHYAGALDLGLGDFGWAVIWQTMETWLAFAGAGQLAFTAQQALPAKAA